jgi:DnaK suppressor protein
VSSRITAHTVDLTSDSAARAEYAGEQENKMALTDTKGFTDLLRAKEATLSGSLRRRDEIVIEKASEALDAVQLMSERDLAVRSLIQDSNMLRQIRRALARIADGSYGVCLQCEEDISPKRMAALPWADFCIKCQEQADRGAITPDHTFEELASAA